MVSSIKRGFHHKLNKVHDKYKKNPHIQSKHRALLYGILLGIVLLLATVSGLYIFTYGDKASPATFLSGTDVSGKSRSEIKYVARNLLDQITITLSDNETTVVATSEDLGMKLMDDESAAAAIDVGNEQNIFTRFNPFYRKDTALAIDYDHVLMQEYLDAKFAGVTTPTKNATITFNDLSVQFDIVPGESGRAIDAEKLSQEIDDILLESTTGELGVKVEDADPKVSTEAAERACDYMNYRIGLRLNLNYNGQLLYFIDPPDIALWADITPNPTTGEIDIEFDEAKIKMFLTNTVAPSIATAPVDEKILIDKEGNQLMVVQHGRNGYQPRDFEALVGQVHDALVSGTDLEQELDLVEAAFNTTRIETDDTNWIEVNLSTQTAMLWNGTQLLRTFIVSTGVAKWPTVTGEFRVWYKTPSQTMTGGSRADGSYYSLDNVQWVSYFFEDYAFHGKWWNNILGSPSSHGCVGMTNADAKIVYDFAPVGTRVVVHY